MTDASRKTNIGAEWARAAGSLRAAGMLLDGGEHNDSVSRAYYAVFHAARSLLLTLGLEPQSHRGTGALLAQHFVATGILDRDLNRVLSRMQKFREEADYNRHFVFDRDEAAEELEAARGFLAAVKERLVRDGWLAGE
jgi:uncharacterized protein (UPF0332 family)